MQLFRDGRPSIVKGPFPPLRVGDATVLPGRSPMKFDRETASAYLVGLKPRSAYDVESDDEEMREERTDSAGTLVLHFGEESQRGCRLKDARTLPVQ